MVFLCRTKMAIIRKGNLITHSRNLSAKYSTYWDMLCTKPFVKVRLIVWHVSCFCTTYSFLKYLSKLFGFHPRPNAHYRKGNIIIHFHNFQANYTSYRHVLYIIRLVSLRQIFWCKACLSIMYISVVIFWRLLYIVP